jgi:hypothetical protein
MNKQSVTKWCDEMKLYKTDMSTVFKKPMMIKDKQESLLSLNLDFLDSM